MYTDLPPSTRTDLGILALGGSHIDDRGDHLVVRTPANPDYHWGNFIQVRSGDVNDVQRWTGLFGAEFPGAVHLAVGLPRRPDVGAWQAADLRIDVTDSLTSGSAPPAVMTPVGYAVSELSTDAHWSARLEAEMTENAATGEYPAEGHRRFLDGQFAARRSLVALGLARWFGVWSADGDLAASLGIVVLGDTARYQFVLTDARHRRRGLARCLLTPAAHWALSRGATELVIVADSGSPAARLYARAGFVPGELGFAAYRFAR